MRYQNDINNLASQLEKLLKVINHSDPSAEKMKHVLYNKYKTQLDTIADNIKRSTSWTEFYTFLLSQKKENNLPVAKENEQLILKKLIKDFEDLFIERHQLSELSPPEPTDVRQKERIKRIRKQIRTNRKAKAKIYPKDDIIEMVQMKNKEKQGKKSLDKLIKAINKVDPNKIDKHLNHSDQE